MNENQNDPIAGRPSETVGRAPEPTPPAGSDEQVGTAPGSDETIGRAPASGGRNMPVLVGGIVAAVALLAVLIGLFVR